MASLFYYFSLTVMNFIATKNQTPKPTAQLPDCQNGQNAARKSFLDLIFLSQFQKVFFRH